MSTTQKDVRKTVRRLSKDPEFQPDEKAVYESDYLRDYLRDLTGTVMGSPKRALNVTVCSQGAEGFTACTDGSSIAINRENRIFSRYETPAARFEAFLGGVYHELAHALFLDFDADAAALESVRKGRFYPKEPETFTYSEKESLKKLKKAMKNRGMREVLGRIWSDLDNIISDRHDEDAMMEYFGCLTRGGICKIRESLRSFAQPYDEMVCDLDSGKADELALAFNAVLQMSRFGDVFMYDEGLWEKDPVLLALSGCRQDIEKAVHCDGTGERFESINRIVLALWPFIEKIASAAEDGNEKPDTEENGGAAARRVDESLRRSEEGFSRGAAAPSGRTSSKEAVPGDSGRKEKTRSDEEQEIYRSRENAGKIFRSVQTRIAGDLAAEKAQQSLAEELSAAVSAVNMNSTHRGVPVRLERQNLDRNPARCLEMTAQTAPLSKRLARSAEQILRELSTGGISRHRQFGRIITPGDAYRPDGRYFAKKNLPKNPPDLAVSVLCDNSGSMASMGRIDAARKAALTIYDFAASAGIPVSVSGHTTDGAAVVYKVFADFVQADGKDRERIAAMEPEDCNRDGCALEIAGSLLESRSEAGKLLIVITDGLPNHLSYGGPAAEEDIRETVNRYRRRGIEVIAASIGSDSEQIKAIYGDGFLNIEDMNSLPAALAGVLRKRILLSVA